MFYYISDRYKISSLPFLFSSAISTLDPVEGCESLKGAMSLVLIIFLACVSGRLDSLLKSRLYLLLRGNATP
jgi:hypothetical protein